jgi:hypothetical protein
MSLKRRHFLQLSASTLATLGLSQLDIMQQGNSVGKVLAQNTGRKLALLVGINQYPQSTGLTPLYGCVTDVRLQQQLLIHRFGFQPQDVLTLTNQQANRQGILTAFEQHLINQARPGDVVVFHFSGHGSRLQDPDGNTPDGRNSALVPIDGTLPLGYPLQGGTVNHIMGRTLFLLMSALQTDNVTVVLDSCYSGGGKRGNLRVRSISDGERLQPNSEELAYQRQWLSKLGMSPQEFIQKRRQAVAKGVVIASAKPDQLAADLPFNDFYAGAFTCLFTQYLWQQVGNEPINRAIANIGRSTKILAARKGNYQDPEFEANLTQPNTNPPIYFVPFQATPAEAVVTQVNGNQAQVWLGGIDSQSLEAFTKNPLFSVVDSQGNEVGWVKLESRQGLEGKGTLVNTRNSSTTLQPGSLLQERIRSIPPNPTLKIGIDESLDSKTVQQAIQAIQAIKRIEPKTLGQQEVQYIFGQMTTTQHQQLQKKGVANLPQVGSFGLFLPSQDQIIPDSFGKTGESVTAAVKRLQPKFKSLLAARVVKQILGNTNSSRLNVTASLNIADSNELLAQTFPVRSATQKANSSTGATSIKVSDSGLRQLPVGTKIAFKIQNDESQPLYVSILVIDAQGDMTVIFPNNWSSSEDAALIEAKQTQLIPQLDDQFVLTIDKPLGVSEALIIASTSPLRTSLQALQKIAISQGIDNTRQPVSTTADELLDVTNNLLDDLDAGTRSGFRGQEVVLPSGVRGIDTQKLAAMAIAFEVVS